MRRTVPFFAALWEVARFFLLFLIMTVQLNRQLSGDMSLFLLWTVVISLAVASALLLAGIDPERYFVFTQLMALIKVVQVFFGVLLIFHIRGLIPAVAAALGGGGGLGQSSPLTSSLPSITIIVGLDLLAAVVLVLYASRRPGGVRHSLPEAEVTEVEEEE